MKRTSDNIDEKGLLKRLDDLINGKDAGRGYFDSFLGFCARMLRIKPKADSGFESSLKHTLLKKHPGYAKDKIGASKLSKSNTLRSKLHDFAHDAIAALTNMKLIKRVAFGGVPVLAIVLALIIIVGNPRVDMARAVEIMESDPQIIAVIEAYDLRVQHVKVKGNIGYILLDRDPDFDDVEVTIAVDMENETVWKIVTQEGGFLSKSEITEYFSDKEANWAEYKKTFAAEAERMGLTLEEYEAQLYAQKAAEFSEKAEGMGMTPEEFKAYLAEEKTAKAEAYISEFRAKAESLGMTIEEYKAYLEAEKAAEKDADLIE